MDASRCIRLVACCCRLRLSPLNEADGDLDRFVVAPEESRRFAGHLVPELAGHHRRAVHP